MIQLHVLGSPLDTTETIDFRLNRFVADLQNFQVRGGDYSSTLSLPATKRNLRTLRVSLNTLAVRQFYREKPYEFQLTFSGVPILTGTLTIDAILSNRIDVTLLGSTIDWVTLLEDLPLNQVGYADGVPTWFGSNKLGQDFKGGETISIVNELTSADTDYICPLLVRNATPLADYLSNSDADIFGVYDGGGTQVQSPLPFPDSFRCVRGFFGTRQGLTFQDLPPALFLRNLLEKIFSSIGYTVSSSLFNSEWFNRLFVSYTGDGYKYNYKTLGKLLVKFLAPRAVIAAGSAIQALGEALIYTNATLPVSMISVMLALRLGANDDPLQRIDYITNFNKFLVTDESKAYVVPADGKYRIQIRAQVDKKLQGSEPDLITWVDTWGGAGVGTTNGWGETAYVLLRKNQVGETVIRPDPLNDVIEYMSGDFPAFPTTSSDIIAYFFPKRADYAGTVAGVGTTGSPLTNFQTTPNVPLYLYTETPSLGERRGFSSCTMSIDIDLLENERVEFYAISLAQPIIGGTQRVTLIDFQVNSSSSDISVTPLCGYDDISLADNLPDMSCKDFVRGVVNTLNLFWTVRDKTVTFLTEDEVRANVSPYDITGRVVANSPIVRPVPMPKRLRVGYRNDPNDKLLTVTGSGCVSDTLDVSSYGNVVTTDSKNIYANGELDALNIFSATRFIDGDLSDCTDVLNSFTKTAVTTADPITGLTFVKGYTFGTNKNLAMFRLQLPSLVSRNAWDVTMFSDLNYEFNQQIRLLQYLGTTGTVTYTPLARVEDYRFKIDAADEPRMLDLDFWIRPTICSFHNETPYYPPYSVPSNANTPLQSLRYDLTNGLYSKYFLQSLEAYNGQTHTLTLTAFLRSNDWNALTAFRTVKYKECLYRLLEITDYDPTGLNPCTLTLVRLT